jgi:molybdopterin/thiamine biosynthesis adenylyltransferase
MERYSRQSILDEIGVDGQVKLGQARVLVVGVGGLGCPAAQYLATAGVGTLILLDDDLVDESNLGRQVLFGQEDVGRPKVEVAKEKLESLNGNIEIVAMRDRFRQGNAEELVSHCDVVMDGSDNFATKFLINDACVLSQTPFSHAGILRWEGQLTTYRPGGPCYRCLFEGPPPSEEVPNCSEVGTLGAVAGVIACMQATEVIKLLLGLEVLSGELVTFDGLSMKSRKIQYPLNSKCRVCGEHADIIKPVEQGVVQCDLRQASTSLLLTFEGHHRVIKAERHLKSKGYVLEPKVTPRQLSHECGICLEVQCSDQELLMGDLLEKKLKPERMGEPSQFLEVTEKS